MKGLIYRIIFQVDLKHIKQEQGSNYVKIGIDLKEFYMSVEWDILDVPARRNQEYYPQLGDLESSTYPGLSN